MKNSKKSIGALLFFILLLFGFIIKNIFDDNSLEKSAKYTIATVKSLDINSKGGFGVSYIFDFNNEKYEKSTVWNEYDKSIVGGRFYVKFSPSKPKNCEILLNERVPSFIKEAPPEGWKEIPR